MVTGTANETILERLLNYSEHHRTQMLLVSGVIAAIIAFVDWIVPPVSFGLFYIIPIIMASSLMPRRWIVAAAVICSFLRELYSPWNWTPDWPWRILSAIAGFAGLGLAISELNRLRLAAVRLLEERERQSLLRREAEERLHILVETSPLAILTLDHAGQIVLANESAQQMLGFGAEPLAGKDVRPYLPVLARPLARKMGAANLRTLVECRGSRKDGEVFMAHIWFSTYSSLDGQAIAAVIWDASESMRDREHADLDSMFDISHILIGAMSHEIRNLAHAAVSAYGNLASLPGIKDSKEFVSLRAIVTALEKMAGSGLKLVMGRSQSTANLNAVFDEARIVLQPAFEEGGIQTTWSIAPELPVVQADHHRLLQVFLNLARNSCRVLEQCEERVVNVEATGKNGMVVITFQDSGPGVADPSQMFRPFQAGAHESGLGLYVSREILRAHGGDLRYEPSSIGACFVVELWPVDGEKEA